MSRKKQNIQKITALYCRLSLEDGRENESMSISNQKLMLKDFAEKNGMFRYEYYVDDGYTGRNFNRPAFQRMIADIEAGKIDCVITKDLSRLGRNYIEAGSYIEIFFPKHHIRYIAILRNPFYKGAHLVCRTHQTGIRSGSFKFIPREDWEVIENCHEAIVSPEEWAKVQELIDRRPTIMTGNDCPYYNIFHGIIYCATCGKSMQARYEKVGRKDIDRTTKKKREPIDKAFFTCQTYNRIGCKVCSSHKIEARDLHELVLNDIQELAAQAMKDSDAFYQRLSRRMENQYRTDTSEVRAEIRRLEERNQEIDDVFLNLYTDKSKGIISEQRFLKLTDAMEQEQNSNKTRLSELNLLLHQSDEQESDVHAFIEEIRKYAAIKELDEVVLNRLIKKIMIGEVQKVDGQKIQEVKIIYNFVGEISA